MKTLVIWLPTSWEGKMKACIDVSPKTLPAVSRLNPIWTSSSGQRSRNSSTRLSPSTTLKAVSFVRPLVTLCPTSFGGNGQESKWIMYQKYRYVFRLLWSIGLRYLDSLARTLHVGCNIIENQTQRKNPIVKLIFLPVVRASKISINFQYWNWY